MQLTELNDGTLGPYLRSSPLLTVLVFHAPWSKPSRTMRPVISEVAASYEHAVRFALIDVEHGSQAIEKHGVLSLPTYLVFVREKLIDRLIGSMTREKLSERMEEILRNSAKGLS